MLYPKIEDCVERVGGQKYALVIVAAKRGKDILSKAGGSFSEFGKKELTFALKEIYEGKVVANHVGGETV